MIKIRDLCQSFFEKLIYKVTAEDGFGIYHHYYLKVNDYPVVYVVKKFSLTETFSPEIENTGWFDYAALPEMTSPGTKRRLSEYFTNQAPSETW